MGDGTVDDTAWASTMSATEWPDEAPPSSDSLAGATPSIGRYIVDDVLGRGGMGTVYRAHDPQIDRPVALKLLRPGLASNPRSEARLLREAQALGKLAHPNVVAVYDAGKTDAEVFLVMELVDGDTLGKWLRRKERSWKQIRDMFVRAGRGLAAAHAVGIAHRDFKPANVLVGNDGRPRVGDFGLARPQHNPDTADDDTGAESSPAGSGSLTVAGTAMGTPAYMAPEHHDGTADTLSDQFSFCVALYEALYKEHPFTAHERPSSRAECEARALPSPPAKAEVPAWLREVVLRGLAASPSQRFASMDDLCAALENDPALRRRRFAVAAGSIAVIGLTAYGAYRLGGTDDNQHSACAHAGDAADIAWTDQHKRQVRAHFRATEKPYADASFSRVREFLDGYVERWRRMSVEACEDTHVRKKQSPRIHKLRRACLDRRLARVNTLVGHWQAGVERDSMHRAVSAVLRLPSLARCADTDALVRTASVPAGSEKTDEVLKLERELERLDTLSTLTKLDRERVTRLVARAEKLGHPSTLAVALLLQADRVQSDGKYRTVQRILDRAVVIAGKGGDDLLVFRAQLWTVDNYERMAKLERALALEPVTRSTIARVGDPPSWQAKLNTAIARVHYSGGKFESAQAYLRKTIELLGQLRRPSRLLGRAYHLSGTIQLRLGKHGDALKLLHKAQAAYARVFGANNPVLADTEHALGTVYWSAGKLGTAQGHFSRALILQRDFYGPNHPRVAATLQGLGSLFWTQQNWPKSLEMFERALAINVKAHGTSHPEVARSHHNVAEVLAAQKACDRAIPRYRKSATMWQLASGKNHPDIAYPLTGLGNCLVRLGRNTAARAPLERALRLRNSSKIDRYLRAETELALARALWGLQGSRKRARGLATKARATYATAGKRFAAKLTAIDKLLAK